MSVTANGQKEQRPAENEEMHRALEFVRQLRETSQGDELRYAFRALANELLDPEGEDELAVCNNDGHVLGYFVPAKRWFRTMAENGPPAPPCMNREDFVKGAVPARELLEQIMKQTS